MNTPTPWIRDKYNHICTRVDKDGYATFASSVCLTDFSLSGGEEAKANTALILRAVNSHDALVNALEDCIEALDFLQDRALMKVNPPLIDNAKATLALAKGEA